MSETCKPCCGMEDRARDELSDRRKRSPKGCTIYSGNLNRLKSEIRIDSCDNRLRPASITIPAPPSLSTQEFFIFHWKIGFIELKTGKHEWIYVKSCPVLFLLRVSSKSVACDSKISPEKTCHCKLQSDCADLVEKEDGTVWSRASSAVS